MAPSIIHLFRDFLKCCLEMQPNLELVLYPAPAEENYGGVAAYMQAVADHQPIGSHDDTLVHLTQLFTSSRSPSNCIQEQPFLMIAACLYLDAVSTWHMRTAQYSDNVLDSLPHYRPLLNIIIEACGIEERNMFIFGWPELNQAIDAIYNHHNPANQPKSGSNSVTTHVNPGGTAHHDPY
jgi:hypothetical protein